MPIITPSSTPIPLKDGSEASMSIDQIVGQNLCRLREGRGIAQVDFAAKIGFTLGQLQAYENGDQRINAEVLHHICEFFDVAPALFFSTENAQFKSYLSRFVDAFLDKTINLPLDVSAEDMLAHIRRYLALNPVQRDQLNQAMAAWLVTNHKNQTHAQ